MINSEPYSTFHHVITGPTPYLGLEELKRTGFVGLWLRSVVPIIGFGGSNSGHKDLWEHTKQVVNQAPPRRTVRIAALYHDVGKPRAFKRIDRKVTFHMHESFSFWAWKRDSTDNPLFPDENENKIIGKLILGLGQVEAYDQDWSDNSIRKLYYGYEEVWDDLIDLALSDITSGIEARRIKASNRTRELNERLQAILIADKRAQETKLPKGLGNVVMKTLGLSGKRLGDFIKKMQAEVEAGRLSVFDDPNDYVDWITGHHDGG